MRRGPWHIEVERSRGMETYAEGYATVSSAKAAVKRAFGRSNVRCLIVNDECDPPIVFERVANLSLSRPFVWVEKSQVQK